jgi:nitrate reductase beta subunit
VDRTNAERQRRYIANLKAAAAQVQDSASLRQENAALRQENTALKQEQQRAMAKAARQEGLAMKALMAAVTKPNGGVVGFLDANLEFHEAECPPPYRLLIPHWVPPEAQPAIAEMWKDTLPDKEVRMALKRLATDKKMEGGVWEKLRNVKGAAEIVPSAIEAFERSALLRPPSQSKQREALQR